jgi:hypothetical protein
MTDRELKHLLEAAKCPERTEDYWQSFPSQVSRRLRVRPAPVSYARMGRFWHQSWKAALAVGTITAGLFVALQLLSPRKNSELQIRVLGESYRKLASLFPNELKGLVMEAGQFRLQLAEHADVPTSPPLFIRLCDPSASKCVLAITFSGQEIELFGRRYEALANGRDEIMLLSHEGLLRPKQVLSGEGLRLEAGWLETKL